VGPIVPPARERHKRRFNEEDKRQILEEAVRARTTVDRRTQAGYGVETRHNQASGNQPNRKISHIASGARQQTKSVT
jgi:hypothetical protein